MIDHTARFRNGANARKQSTSNPPINATRTSVSHKLDNGRWSTPESFCTAGFIGNPGINGRDTAGLYFRWKARTTVNSDSLAPAYRRLRKSLLFPAEVASIFGLR